MPLGITGRAIAGECGERFAQAPLGIEAGMRHRHRIHEQRVTTESLHLESQLLEGVAVGFEGVGFVGAEVQRHREEQSL